jgi:hypothetical protein
MINEHENIDVRACWDVGVRGRKLARWSKCTVEEETKGFVIKGRYSVTLPSSAFLCTPPCMVPWASTRFKLHAAVREMITLKRWSTKSSAIGSPFCRELVVICGLLTVLCARTTAQASGTCAALHVHYHSFTANKQNRDVRTRDVWSQCLNGCAYVLILLRYAVGKYLKRSQYGVCFSCL